MSSKHCSICKKPIKEGKYIQTAGLICHSSCLKCAHCNGSIESSYVDRGDSYYHPPCFAKVEEENAVRAGHVCARCGKACTVGKYFTVPSGERYHADCFICMDCSQPIKEQYISYGDTKIPLHPACARKRDVAVAIAEGKVCQKCRKPCIEGKTLTLSENEMYHAECFLCTKCKKPISSQYVPHGEDKQPYHIECIPGAAPATAPSSSSRRGSEKLSSLPGGSAKANRICKKCKQECTTGKFFNTSGGDIYHADCFRCSDPNCNQPIIGPYTSYGEPPLPYHSACGKELFAPRCCLCTTAMEGHFYKHPYFETEKYCLSHETRASCFACGRKEPLPSSHKEGFVDLLDGRSLCAQCSSSIIVDSSEAAALYRDIVEYMGTVLGLPIPAEMRDVPILLVDVQTLNENRGKLGNALGHHAEEMATVVGVRGAHDENAMPMEGAPAPFVQVRGEAVIRGVTLSKCSEVRHMPSTRLSFTGGRNSIIAGQLPEVYRVTQTRDVSAVLVLYGLPRDLTASILAHEAMHVWLKLNKGFPFRMPPKLEEGLCQVIAYLYLDKLASDGAARNAASALAGAHTLQPSGSKTLLSPRVAPNAASSLPHASPPNAAHAKPRRPSSGGARKTSATARAKHGKTLTSWFREQILVDKSPIYGKGFEEVFAAVSALGLDAVLTHIKKHQVLPTVPKSASRLPPLKT